MEIAVFAADLMAASPIPRHDGIRDRDRAGGAVEKNRDGRRRRFSKWVTSAWRYRQNLERRRWVTFPLDSVRRFNRIEGKHLALVITVNVFVAIIPLIIVGYAFLEGFNPHRSFGGVIVESFHLTGSTAQIVQNTFATAKSGQSVALSISVISLLITGLDVSATTQLAYARAFTMTPLRGVQKYLRGGAWLILLLVSTGATLTLRYLAADRPLWFLLAAIAVLLALQFGFFLVTPRLLLDLPFAWRDLVPGAAICTGAAIVVHAVAVFFLHRWFGAYGSAYGSFGIGLAMIAFIGIFASFWVWIAAAMGVYWERRAGPAAVAKMEKLSANISPPAPDQAADLTDHPAPTADRTQT
jgi:uncharacterized BrkB/YihY/UPF0761 family membrane protein